jgi:uncharacterized protein YidB (DUF937 family)
MGLLDAVIGDVSGNAGGSASPMGAVLANLLGSGAGGQSLIQGQGTGDGLGASFSSFEQAGLGHIIQSWIGNGPNQPVSAQQLQSVMGNDQVQSMASQAGMSPNDFLSRSSVSISLTRCTL